MKFELKTSPVLFFSPVKKKKEGGGEVDRGGGGGGGVGVRTALGREADSWTGVRRKESER